MRRRTGGGRVMIEDHAGFRAGGGQIDNAEIKHVLMRPAPRRTQAQDAPSVRRNAGGKFRPRSGGELFEPTVGERDFPEIVVAVHAEAHRFLIGGAVGMASDPSPPASARAH